MLKHSFTIWQLDKPLAASMDGWKDWHEENKKKYPIRYFLQETLPVKSKKYYNRLIGWPISKFYWGIKYRFIPKHQYHFINTGLKPNYYEIDTRILHGCFNLFKEFYEYQLVNSHIDWEHDEQHKEIWNEMSTIYNWWLWYNNDREKELKPYPKIPKEQDSLYFIFSDRERKNRNPILLEWDKVSEENFKTKESWEKQEEEMFIRLIKIRRHLWD
jgi:hypothetical protein